MKYLKTKIEGFENITWNENSTSGHCFYLVQSLLQLKQDCFEKKIVEEVVMSL
jgi:hypothetical protein